MQDRQKAKRDKNESLKARDENIDDEEIIYDWVVNALFW